jgi:hypothetical protein
MRSALHGASRQVKFMGRTFRVVSAVLVRSQVLHNNLGHSYLPAEEITSEWAELWNGIPVLVGPHPRMRGEHVSGRRPELWEQRMVGWIFNAKAEQEGRDVRRLVAEVWLDESRASEVEGFQAVLDALAASRVVELSTGFNARTEQAAGQFGGQAFDLIMRPTAPDHLVIATDMTGACSVSDGCGLGANCGCGGHRREEVGVEPTKSKTIFARLAELLGASRPALTAEEIEARRIAREVETLNAMNPSDGERMNMLRDALQAAVGGPDRQVIVADVFSGENKVIYWFSTPIGAFPAGSEFFMATYTLNTETGATTFGEPTRVRRMMTYETVANEAAEQVKSAGDAGVAAAVNTSPDTGKGAEMSEQNTELAAQVASLVAAVQSLGERFTAIETAAKSDANPAIAGLKKQLGVLTDEFSRMREVTEQAVAERERERQEYIRQLAGHVRVPFTEAELEAKPLEELRKIHQLAQGANFAGRGGPQGERHAAEQTRYAEPVSPWSKDKKGAE